jgi:hypothetical protein
MTDALAHPLLELKKMANRGKVEGQIKVLMADDTTCYVS